MLLMEDGGDAKLIEKDTFFEKNHHLVIQFVTFFGLFK